MHFYLRVAGAGVTLSVLLLSLIPSSSAGPKDEVAAAASTWARALGEDDPDKVLPLYSDDAVLWGTLSPTVRADRASLRDYFVTAFKVLPGLKVTFGDQLIRVYGSTAVNTGYYTFTYVKDGETKRLACALQLHPCQERRALAGRRPSLLSHAAAPEVTGTQASPSGLRNARSSAW